MSRGLKSNRRLLTLLKRFINHAFDVVGKLFFLFVDNRFKVTGHEKIKVLSKGALFARNLRVKDIVDDSAGLGFDYTGRLLLLGGGAGSLSDRRLGLTHVPELISDDLGENTLRHCGLIRV